LLRRTETVAAAKSEGGSPQPARYEVEWATGSSLDRRQPTDRRQTERRGMDRLRAEALQSVIARVEDRNFNGLRDRMRWPRAIPPSRLLLIGVAVLAAGAAAFLANQYEQPSTAAATAVMPVEAAKPVTRILVAAQAVGTGQRFTAQSLQWQDWPDSALRPEFITAAADPDALSKTQGSVARVDFVAGDPIVAQKLAPAGGGFLSAILSTGMRAVSVTIAADAASGGFVVPNDHVDVVLTRSANGDPANQESHIILRDVRVLAINTRLGAGPTASEADGQDPASQVFTDKAIATLELDPTQSEVIINATTLGRLSLVLRPATDTIATASQQAADAERAANAAIRLSSPFWTK
jgi:pilus assembly protein CpaB